MSEDGEPGPTVDPEPTLGQDYRRCRERLTALLAEEPDTLAGHGPVGAWHAPVPACPGWTVHDVVGHLVGTIEDAMAGRITGPPGEDVTAAQVARHATDPGPELLARWGELAPPFEDVVTGGEIWPAVFDVLSHEHDVRHALDRPAGRDDDLVVRAAVALVEALPLPWTLELELAGPGGAPPGTAPRRVVRSAPADGPTYRLRTSAFEVLRLRLGRRSRAEVRALAWDPIPPPDLTPLFVFGPRPTPLRES